MVPFEDIEQFASDIARRYGPQMIVLFGSQASRTASDDSDVDLLVIMDYEGMRARKAAEIVCSINPKFSVDLLLRSPAEVEARRAASDHFMLQIISEGTILYERVN